ncbi:MAG: HAD family hydrolase [Cyanobacteria bacterium J069]|nr:MAG: HAD family phosphatase [Cyanobacteria bacterium J069]
MPLDLPDSIRLIATDMDGTLTRRGKFTPLLLQTLEALQTAGIPVVIVTGRSAGWVHGVVSYLPVAGAIAENGGLFFPGDTEPEFLVDLPEISTHRQALANLFHQLQQDFPQIQEAPDNRFRLTDWTFDVRGLSPADLQAMGDRCRSAGWGFTYSTVQCHIKPAAQDKATALAQVLQRHFPDISPVQLVTVGDSPNDESLFNGDRFPHSVGVGNVRHYLDGLAHKPAGITHAEEVEGFWELAQQLLGQPLTSSA